MRLVIISVLMKKCLVLITKHTVMEFHGVRVSEPIIEPVDINEANELMPMMLEIGMMNGHLLLMNSNVLQNVCDQIKQTNK